VCHCIMEISKEIFARQDGNGQLQALNGDEAETALGLASSVQGAKGIMSHRIGRVQIQSVGLEALVASGGSLVMAMGDAGQHVGLTRSTEVLAHGIAQNANPRAQLAAYRESMRAQRDAQRMTAAGWRVNSGSVRHDWQGAAKAARGGASSVIESWRRGSVVSSGTSEVESAKVEIESLRGRYAAATAQCHNSGLLGIHQVESNAMIAGPSNGLAVSKAGP